MITFFSVALIHIVLINAVTALPVAVLAYTVNRWAERPALTHALWGFVLLKLVTPPLFQLPITVQVPADVSRDWAATEFSTNGQFVAASAVSGNEASIAQDVFNSTSSPSDLNVVDRGLDTPSVSSSQLIAAVQSNSAHRLRAAVGSSAW